MNTVIEDDSGMPVGDLFLNPIREEMDEAAYDALPDEDKKKHADLSKMIIEGKDITTTNDSGQKIFVKNLQAYYEAARPLI